MSRCKRGEVSVGASAGKWFYCTCKRRKRMNTVFCLETNIGIDGMGSSSVVLLFELFH